MEVARVDERGRVGVLRLNHELGRRGALWDDTAEVTVRRDEPVGLDETGNPNIPSSTEEFATLAGKGESKEQRAS